MGIAKVTRNFQVTLPKDVRKVHNIKIGDTVLFTCVGNELHVRKLNITTFLNEIAGSWTTDKDLREVRKEWKKRY